MKTELIGFCPECKRKIDYSQDLAKQADHLCEACHLCKRHCRCENGGTWAYYFNEVV